MNWRTWLWWVGTRFSWVIAPGVWVVHAIFHWFGFPHVEGPWWWF